ncbi:hypothetical protein QJU89_03780 [Pasteurella skyensis]|uniref:Uncharacterized protein n=1 Tax=Phocoenobacter skyensis TaxID=97481 RepID=A0AAJ6NZY7_9PAST|nr:hypothetical protein [Pasteurella skyensis]MDP8161956.1 hypothetical protein [Pasteurella skyensis]MDP8170267.1 hypothetical protein [Pasteurella skyensis]MDP8172112.1 hypothetical protein [Pasteurella skyensis]MDP8176540.1 hypothetical protein [Pasteurella skyensis]MDP8178428.1 hypothetical protein [Pasteurella skyensis]
MSDMLNPEIKSGAVIKIFCEFTRPPKYKFLMIACIDPLLAFVINSDINDFIKNRPELLQDQVDIPASDHHFLVLDSVMNCVQVHQAIEISSPITNNDLNNAYQGHIQHYCLREIIRVVDESVNLNTIQKKLIINSINADNRLNEYY